MNTLSLFKNRPILSAVAFAMAVGVPASFYAAPAPVEAAAGDLDRAVDALRGISTMKADFVQTDRNGNSVTGVMTLKRPGKIRFEYEKGADLLVVSNGKSMYMIDYSVNQVQRWPIKNSPLGALLDPSRDVKKYGKLVPTSHDDVVSIEVRDKDRPEFGVITLIFARDGSAPGGLRLTHWVALDSQNHRTTVRLRNHRYGMSVADSAFTFRDPRKSSRRPG
ncbi:LolA family protein [Qipengyuania gelatinilytica]|uniref:Outer membrane lipoprotein carrier protein LolA n=1 Tax=Qipengyuania gelatinilytica TaxID=2867231 RepID=A0ABX9A550_9SPHN|nr:outer membrane lipoprotein carrier protein LolA [Qipengyuania gelatinilytica]QZD96420.1 outer membrane lipoprotein carrier protein LolA [Qipengyuania gelatinilytica]